MTHAEARLNVHLRSKQLNGLLRLLEAFETYKTKQANLFFSFLDSMYLVGLPTNLVTLDGTLICSEQGLSINEFFSMYDVRGQGRENSMMLATVIKIYAEMQISFDIKQFSFLSLFIKASTLMVEGKLSPEASVRIISLLRLTYAKAELLLHEAENIAHALASDAPGVEQETMIQRSLAKSKHYPSYQQAPVHSRVSTQGIFSGLFQPLGELGSSFVELRAHKNGYTVIN